MTIDRWLALGATLYIAGAIIGLAALAVQSHRTNQYTRAVDTYSKAVTQAGKEAEAASARGDFAEAHRILDAVPRPPSKAAR